MRHFKITPNGGGEPFFIAATDDQDEPPGHDPANGSVEEVAADPDERALVEAKIGSDPAKAEEWAEARAQAEAEAAALSVADLRRQIAMGNLYQEVQLLKLASLVPNGVPGTVAERTKMFPNLMAHVEQIGSNLPTVAAAAENRLAGPIRKMAVVEARLLRALDAVKSAPNAAAKLAAIEAIDWSKV